jgi:hypothetical protein
LGNSSTSIPQYRVLVVFSILVREYALYQSQFLSLVT